VGVVADGFVLALGLSDLVLVLGDAVFVGLTLCPLR
jgi:hypothetical protein